LVAVNTFSSVRQNFQLFPILIVAVGVVVCYTTVLRLFTFSDRALAFQRFTC